MHTSKILVGNSGDKVYLHEDKVIKEAERDKTGQDIGTAGCGYY